MVLGILENRFPTLFDLHRALWPVFERLRDPSQFHPRIEGSLDHVILADFERFRQVIKTLTGHAVPVIQRAGDEPPTGQLPDDLSKNLDGLIVVSLDHLRTSQAGMPGEIQLIRQYLSNEGRGILFACDAMVWTSTFVGLESLQAFWGNLAKLKV